MPDSEFKKHGRERGNAAKRSEYVAVTAFLIAIRYSLITNHYVGVHDIMFSLYDDEQIQKAMMRDARKEGIKEGEMRGRMKGIKEGEMRGRMEGIDAR